LQSGFFYNFWCKFLCNRFWIMNLIILFKFFHHFIALLSIRQSCKFFIYCDLAWNSIMETIIFSTWVVTSSVESCALTTFGANFWATGFVFSVHWATLLLIASGVSSKLFLKNQFFMGWFFKVREKLQGSQELKACKKLFSHQVTKKMRCL